MGDCKDEENKWELSKENIQPLKQGRKAAVLSVALDESQHQKLNIQKHEFEKLLRTYSGDDPLEVWYKYALWIEQNYVKGGNDGNLKKLLDSCFKTLNLNKLLDKYNNDDRFLDLWIKYANLSSSPIDIYQILNSQNHCNELSRFYVSWAWEVEKLRNFKKANAIYVEGIQKNAKPLDELQAAHKKFQARVAHQICHDDNSHQSSDSEFPNRKVLSSLKSTGVKPRAPIERVGPSILGSAGQVATSVSKPNVCGPNFQIFQENAPNTEKISSPVKKGKNLPSQCLSNKENVNNPSIWTKKKMTQKSLPVISVDEVDKYNTLNFKVLPDDNIPQCKGKSEIVGVLTAKKFEDDWDVPLFIVEEYNPLARPQYPKHKVYCGTEEFSLEEIRAARRLELEKEKQKEEEKSAMEEELQKLREIIRQQQEIIYKKANPAKATDQPSRMYEDNCLATNRSVNVQNNTTHNLSSGSRENTGFLMLQNPSTDTLKLQPMPTELINYGVLGDIASPPRSDASCTNSEKDSLRSPTINTKLATNAISDLFSGSFFHAASFTAAEKPDRPSTHEQNHRDQIPHVIEEAPAVPFTIYSDENINPGERLPPKDIPHVIEEAPAVPFTIYSDENINPGERLPPKDDIYQTIKIAEVPFSICCDENATTGPTKYSKETTSNRRPFEIYSDENATSYKTAGTRGILQKEIQAPGDENVPPPDYVKVAPKRSLVGVLQPSLDIPVAPLMEKEECQHENDELYGIEPLRSDPEVDFTIKIPSSSEAFAKFACSTSTPAPWNVMGAEPQEDTFVMPILKADICSDKAASIKGERSSKIKENCRDILLPPPPPPPVQETSITSAEKTQTMTCTSKTQLLSPITEASREYRSSSSSSSNCSTLHGHSNMQSFFQTFQYGSVGNLQHSQIKGIAHGSTMNQNFGAISGYDATKSGYFADKSTCESTNDTGSAVPNTQAHRRNKCEKSDRSFDPEQIAAALLDSDAEIEDSESPRLPRLSSQSVSKTKLLKYAVDLPSDIDPFCDELQKKLLTALTLPVNQRGGFVSIDTKMPVVKKNFQLFFGKEKFYNCQLRATGGYAHIYQASTSDSMNVTVMENSKIPEESQMILKIQRPAALWEFYICHELRERIKARQNHHLIDSFMRVNRGYFFNEGSILVNDYHNYGTILNIVNGYKKAGRAMPQAIAMYFVIEVLSLMEELHACDIIHGDLKPDNLLLTNNCLGSEDPNDRTCIKMIDFGRSIDMRLLPTGTTFTKKVKTDGFTCCEMKDGLPWTYQTDFYGAAAVAHCLLWGSYMNVRKVGKKWTLTGVVFQRFWDKSFWQSFFDQMLNIPSCSELPSIELIIKGFKEQIHLPSNEAALLAERRTLKRIINQGIN